MSYKSILTVLNAEADVAPMLASATALAARHDAHLEICTIGVDTTQSAGFYAGAPAMLYQDALEAAQSHAEKLAQAARDRMRLADIRWSVESGVMTLGGIAPHIGQKARYADLVVLPLPYAEGRGPQDEITTEAALFDGNAPVLVLPRPGAELPEFDRIVLAWNESDEALRAARAALPLLQTASLVNVVVIDPPSSGPERSDPGGLLTQMLARHGAHAEVSVLARTLPRVSDVLQRHATDRDADLLVVGAYSHSRLRQAILGGTTRDLLEGARMPVFLAR